MARVVRNPKDAIDEMIESARIIQDMLAVTVGPHAEAAQHVRDAVDDLQKARADVLRAPVV